MNKVLNNLPLSHIAKIERSYPYITQLFTMGYLVDKRQLLENAEFETFNFSFILKGKGFYCFENSKKQPIKAPCVITQWPDKKVSYGPSKNGWHELYISYETRYVPYLKSCGYISEKKPFWQVQRQEDFYELCQHMLSMTDETICPDLADKLDRMADTLLHLSLLPLREIKSDYDRIVIEIKNKIEKDPSMNIDYDKICDDYQITESVFKRTWRKHIGIPPHQYVIMQRIQKARYLLATTTLSVKAISNNVGYEDQLYFSRLFFKYTGMNASEYRKISKSF